MPCTEDDADDLWEKDFGEYQAPVPADTGKEERLVFKIADGSDRIIGGCVLDIDPTKIAEFERLWVDEPCRRRGMASALIHEAERAAKDRRCRTAINAYVFDFQAVRQLFKKHGYRVAGTIKNWPRGHE